MSGEISGAIMKGMQVSVTADCWPMRGPVGAIRVRVMAQTWNGVKELSRRIELGSGNPEALDRVIAETVTEMAEAIDLGKNWEG